MIKNFFRKLFERLLSRTDALQKKLDASLAPNDPLRKKMNNLVAKRDAYRRANPGSHGPTQSLRKTLSESVAAKKAALNQSKKNKNVKRPKRAKVRHGK